MIKSHLILFTWIIVIGLLAEKIGMQKIALGSGAIVMLPLFFAVLFGLTLSSPIARKFSSLLKKSFSDERIANAGKILGIVMLPLGFKLGTMVGSKFDIILEAGPALLLQQIGNLGTFIFGFPVALALGLRREALGATISICREPTIGVMGERYNASSPEMLGAIGVYMIGNVFGTIIFSLIGSFGLLTGLHPYALAMGSGIGSASMSTAALTSLVGSLPAGSDISSDALLAFGMTSNLLSNITEAYFVIFITLPLANFFFKKLKMEEKR